MTRPVKAVAPPTRRRSRVRTERNEMSLTEFEAELFRLEEPRGGKKILLYGDSNAGKTYIAGGTPGHNFWAVSEPGYHAARHVGGKGLARPINNTATAWAFIDWLRVKDRQSKYDWIVHDGLSTLEKKARVGYAQEAFDINPAKRAHRNLPDRPDYFNTQNFIYTYIAALVDLPGNLLLTAHAYRTDRTDAELKVFPGFQGKVDEVANGVSGLMDVVGYVKRSNDVTKVLFHPYTNKEGVFYYAGDKFNRLPKVMTNPTMTEILSYLDAETEEEE